MCVPTYVNLVSNESLSIYLTDNVDLAFVAPSVKAGFALESGTRRGKFSSVGLLSFIFSPFREFSTRTWLETGLHCA